MGISTTSLPIFKIKNIAVFILFSRRVQAGITNGLDTIYRNAVEWQGSDSMGTRLLVGAATGIWSVIGRPPIQTSVAGAKRAFGTSTTTGEAMG